MKKFILILSAFLMVGNSLIAQVGGVGINTSTPQAMLHVVDSNVLFSALGMVPEMPGDPPMSDEGRRMMWYPEKAAFRSGYAVGTQWNKANIGSYSFASGYNTIASGYTSTAMGHGCLASGQFSTALGINTVASGEYSTSIGAPTFSLSGYEIALGRWNTAYTPVSTIDWSSSDRLLVIGNGTDQTSRSDALTILKNGKIGIGTSTPQARLHVVDSSVLFSAAGDFPVPQGDPPRSGSGRRMMWYPEKAAFRTGYVSSTQWDKVNIGLHSFASGRNSIASGGESTAMGSSTVASGGVSTAMGAASIASGFASTAMGNTSVASGPNSTSIGVLAYSRSFSEIALGIANTDYTPVSTIGWNPSDRLLVIGNGTSDISRSDAMTILKNGNTGIGVSTPLTKLHVTKGNSGATFHSGAVIGVEDDANTYVNIVTPSANESGVLFGTTANAAFGGIIYNNDHITDPNSLYFRANSATRMAIYQNGTAWLQSTLTIGNDGQLRVYDASGTRYVQLNHSSGGNLHMDAMGGGTNYVSWYGGSGLHVGNGTSGGYGPVNASAFMVSSARRFKKDIVDMHYGLAEILQMQGKEYVYINDPTNHHEIGLIAEEVERIVPEVVYHDPNDNQVFGIDYGKLTPVLIEAIKEQQNQIEHQTHLIADQQQQIDELRMLVNKLLAE